jgi:hypothetical protein
MTSSDREFERITSDWLNDGSDSTPPHVIDAVLLAVRITPQERGLRNLWRTPLYAAAVIAVVVVAGIAALYALSPRPNFGSEPGPSTPQTQAPGSTSPAAASPTTTSQAAIDTTGWTPYESERYGFTIGHPPDWTVSPADHDWTLAEDSHDGLSTGQEVFMPPDQNTSVSAWSVPNANGESAGVVAAWIEAYCQEIGTPCPDVQDRATPLCVEVRDCHPGLLVPFENDVMAFFTGGHYHEKMVVVAVWRGDSDPSVAPYGGSTRLLEAFLSTMDVWTEATRDVRIEELDSGAGG